MLCAHFCAHPSLCVIHDHLEKEKKRGEGAVRAPPRKRKKRGEGAVCASCLPSLVQSGLKMLLAASWSRKLSHTTGIFSLFFLDMVESVFVFSTWPDFIYKLLPDRTKKTNIYWLTELLVGLFCQEHWRHWSFSSVGIQWRNRTKCCKVTRDYGMPLLE